MPRSAYLTGQRFGKLVVISEHGKDNWGKSLWLCRCDCGRETVVTCTRLTSKKRPTRSCGCLLTEINRSMRRVTPHGLSYVMAVLGRLHRIAERLEGGKWINAMELSGEEEVSIKTIYRTMDFFRDQLRWDIEVSRIGYRLKDKGQALISRQPRSSPCAKA